MRRVLVLMMGIAIVFIVGCNSSTGENINTDYSQSSTTTVKSSDGFDKQLRPEEIAYQSAQQFLSSGKHSEAIRSLEEAVSIRPTYLEAWSQLGSTYTKIQEYEKGIAAYKNALELSPGDESLITSIGYNYLNLKNWDEAEAYYLMLLEKDPNHHSGNINLAFIAQSRDRIDEAITYYKAALVSSPNDARTMGTISDLYGKLDNKEKKFEYLNKAIEADPKNHEFKKKLAKAYFTDRDYKSSIPIYEELTNIYPDIADYHQRLGFAYSQANRTSEAPAELEKAVSLSGGDPFTYAIMAKIYNENNMYNKAITSAKAGINIENGGDQAAILYYQWGEALSKLDSYEEAIVKFEKVVSLNDPVWSKSAEKQLTRQNQLIKIREAKKEQELYE
ncbi:MAG: tetratricopeptide repeat protein [Candidatus Krumholzibacteriota bacterium]|nr:tetratricopeptide repeat protein [Candidatus Krumholzibacteriota bacterium]